MDELKRRREFSNEKFEALRQQLDFSKSLLKSDACVYAIGSYGRQEASNFSDLDLFIVGLNNGKPTKEGIEGSKLRELDAICVKADLISVAKKCGIAEFDADGKYLSHFSVQKITKTLGTPEDDAANTFTARLLLLLESTPLLDNEVYKDVIEDVLAAYWRDYEDHSTNFVPAYLANDILRLWRTFCVNYEARTSREPEAKKAAGKLKNYKLKHGRILTCYSALLFLLVIFGRNKSVSPIDAKSMVSMTPTQRLEWLVDQEDHLSSRDAILRLLDQYDKFLVKTNYPEADLIEKFQDRESSKAYLEDSYEFGNLMFNAINSVGNGSRLHRLIVV